MKTVDYSIEYAHVYSNESFNGEHMESIKVLEKVLEIIKNENKTYNLNLLIDEYHPDGNGLDIPDFINTLKSQNYLPDFVYLESKLHDDIKILLDSFTNKKHLKTYNYYYRKSGKSPCSFLIASWYLKRLGAIPINGVDIINNKKPFIGMKVVNILDKKYQKSENKALELIRCSRFSEYLHQIIYYYY